ncbi:hypothetical protein [Longimicrobium sp.]|jgi:hypothetical protein|uniref:hypothetical protein n=1 Tax=Longimicrobium sp. TaxID=2029185 RepID=UPI002ED941B2
MSYGRDEARFREKTVVTAPVLYLDTLHISRLARHPGETSCAAVLELLQKGSARLAFSVLHMVELSDPGFKSFPDVCTLLDTVPIAWAITPEKLFDREVEAGFARALGAQPPKVRAFFETPAAALNYLALENAPPSDALQVMRENPHLRAILLDEADVHARDYDTIKTEAAAVRRPLEPLRARIRDQQIRQTPAGIHLPVPLPPDVIVERAGGLRGFPAYEVFQTLNVTRLRDTKYRTERNTIIDEWHAVYSPYVAAVALDRATARRFLSTRLPATDRVTEKIADIPGLLGAAV